MIEDPAEEFRRSYRHFGGAVARGISVSCWVHRDLWRDRHVFDTAVILQWAIDEAWEKAQPRSLFVEPAIPDIPVPAVAMRVL